MQSKKQPVCKNPVKLPLSDQCKTTEQKTTATDTSMPDCNMVKTNENWDFTETQEPIFMPLGKISCLVPNTALPSKASTCHGNNEVDNQL